MTNSESNSLDIKCLISFNSNDQIKPLEYTLDYEKIKERHKKNNGKHKEIPITLLYKDGEDVVPVNKKYTLKEGEKLNFQRLKNLDNFCDEMEIENFFEEFYKKLTNSIIAYDDSIFIYEETFGFLETILKGEKKDIELKDILEVSKIYKTLTNNNDNNDTLLDEFKKFYLIARDCFRQDCSGFNKFNTKLNDSNDYTPNLSLSILEETDFVRIKAYDYIPKDSINIEYLNKIAKNLLELKGEDENLFTIQELYQIGHQHKNFPRFRKRLEK